MMVPSPENELLKAKDLESVVFSNDLILKNILAHTFFKDLLNCSLVNRRWRYYSRAELRKRSCFASMNRVEDTDTPPCQKLSKLNNILELCPAKLIPFIGLQVDCNHRLVRGGDLKDCIRDSGSAQDFIISKCPLKFLHIIIHNESTDCPAMELVKLLLQKRGHEIEQLRVGGRFRGLLTDILGIPDLSLPILRVLKTDANVQEQDLDKFINVAPNLSEIWGWIEKDLFPLLVNANRVNLVRECNLFANPATNVEDCLKFARLGPNLKVLSIYLPALTSREHLLDKWLEVLVLLIKSSAATLEELTIHHKDLLLLSTLTFPPLFKLKSLRLEYNPVLDRHLGLNSLQRINFHEGFPALESVIFGCYTGVTAFANEIFPTLLERVSRQGVYTCATVRSLQLPGNSINEGLSNPLTVTQEIFPAVTSFSLWETQNVIHDVAMVLGSNWPLENLSFKFELQDQDTVTELNALLCGIHPEEYTNLETTFEPVSLQEFHLVPLERSLLNFKSLRSLKIRVRLLESSTAENIDLISKSTWALVLSRIPGLKFEIL